MLLEKFFILPKTRVVRGDPNFKKNKRRINRFLEETFAKSNEDIFRFAVGRYVGRYKIMGYRFYISLI